MTLLGRREARNTRSIYEVECDKLKAENARLRAELEDAKHLQELLVDIRDKEISNLQLELDKLKPVEVVTGTFARPKAIPDRYGNAIIECVKVGDGFENLRLTFHDGKLVKAEVLK